MRKSFVFILCSILLIFELVFANNMLLHSQITAVLKKNEFQIGDEINITYDISNIIKKTPKAKLIPPKFKENFGTFEVVNYKYDTILNTFNLCLRTFEVGQLYVPELVFSFEIDNSDRLFTKTSEVIYIHVIEPELVPELKDIPPELLSEQSPNYIVILFFSLLFFIMLVLATMIIRKQHK